MKKVLVTGGAGFIGSNLVRSINNQEVEITIIDNLFSGFSENLENQQVKLIKEDICNFDFSAIEPQDEIYHLACPASPVHYQEDPFQTLNTCFIGTQKVLEFAKQQNSKVVFTSTSEVYGDPEVSPQKESYNGNVNPLTIRSCYDEGKRVAETLCFEYQRQGLDVRIARLFNTYGPLMAEDDGRVVSNFICQALHNKPLTIYGSGQQTRSLCYVDDTVQGLVELMNTENKGKLITVNIGNDSELTINEIAETIVKLTHSKASFKNLPLPIADPQIRKPCLEKAQKLINWQPKITLEEGLVKTIKYYQQRIKKPTRKTA